MSTTIRMTVGEAIVRWLIAQRTELDGEEVPLFPGVFAIFGHGNVTSLGLALKEFEDSLPTWRGQNEQGMALAALGYAKAMRRRQIMVATSSIGPGALNMVTAAGVAHANRLPLLVLAGETFSSRIPDPVLQQVEHFHDPTITVNDAFRAVSRYWDRISRPGQLLASLPHALAIMLDPVTCGPAVLSLPQDVQSEALDVPTAFLAPTLRHIPRSRPDRGQLERAAALIRRAKRPLIIAGGGVRYSGAHESLCAFAERHAIPVTETMAGKTTLLAEHPLNVGPIGVTGCAAANEVAGQADVIIAVGTRLGDFTTGSWTVFGEHACFVSINTARHDAVKRGSVPLIGDADETLGELDGLVGEWTADLAWQESAAAARSGYHAYIDRIAAPTATPPSGLPSYAQVIGVVARRAEPTDYVLTAAGGFPGEMNNGWRAIARDSFDCEYGFSCMGYELSGAWGAKMALPGHEVISFVGDGSYLMMNSDLYSSVLAGHKLIVVLCDNGGYAVINRLQVNQGGEPFNNLLADVRHAASGEGDGPVRVDFAAHARAMGCLAEHVADLDELDAALTRARRAERTTVIVIDTDPATWTEGGAFWEVGVPEVSHRAEVGAARAALVEGKRTQRVGR